MSWLGRTWTGDDGKATKSPAESRGAGLLIKAKCVYVMRGTFSLVAKDIDVM